jgi:hypothetical protein
MPLAVPAERSGAVASDLTGQLNAVHSARHHDVRKDQVYRASIGQSAKRGASAGDTDYLVAKLVEHRFSWGGFMLGSTAKTLADNTANSVVVAAIAPICVDKAAPTPPTI